MLDAVAGWLGLLMFGVALALAVALEVRDQWVNAAQGAGPSPQRTRRVLHVLLGIFVAAALAATVGRFYAYLT
jgi:hypothetical protein